MENGKYFPIEENRYRNTAKANILAGIIRRQCVKHKKKLLTIRVVCCENVGTNLRRKGILSFQRDARRIRVHRHGTRWVMYGLLISWHTLLERVLLRYVFLNDKLITFSNIKEEFEKRGQGGYI